MSLSLPDPTTTILAGSYLRPASARYREISSMIAETLWYVHELELEAVGVDEEDRIVARLVPYSAGGV